MMISKSSSLFRIALGAFLLIPFSRPTSAEPSGLLAEKGPLILSDDFTKAPTDRKAHDISEGWQRRVSFGNWTPIKGGGLKAVNVPEDDHGPVLVYMGTLKDVIIECEFRLPEKDGPNRHFRIFRVWKAMLKK